MKYSAVLILLLPAFICAAKDERSAEKNKKIVDKEEVRFHRDLARHSDTGRIYYEHAKNLADIGSEAGRALGFYRLALRYDSANAIIYKDYGRYLFERQHSYNEARAALEAALRITPRDVELVNDLTVVNRTIDMVDAENRLRDFGTTNLVELNKDTNYVSTAKYDSLRLLTADPSSKFYYPSQIKRFLADDGSLTPQEMYMLIIGYSRQSEYNPFNYNDISELKMIAGHNPDDAISKGLLLVEANPLNPSLNRELMYCFRKKNDAQNAEKYLGRIRQFFSGVLYSGNGTCSRPYISLWAKEEYNFISYLGYKATDVHSMGLCAGKMAEIIDVTSPATLKTTQLYFNVSLIYMQAVGK